MNMSTVLGFLASLAVLFGAIAMSSKNVNMFLDTHAFLIVVGGTAAASLVCFSLPRVLGISRVFVRRMLGKSRLDPLAVIAETLIIAKAEREGRAALATAAAKVQNPFLREAAGMLSWIESDIAPEEIRSLLETQAETHFHRYGAEADIFKTMARFPPAFGLMGTTLGMIALLQSLGGSDAKSIIGPSMSVALVATLYGIVLSNFVFIPIAENLSTQTKEDLAVRRIVIEGIMLIIDGKPIRYIEEKLKAYLLPSERGKGPLSGPMGVAGRGTTRRAEGA